MAYLAAEKIGLQELFRLILRARPGPVRVPAGDAELRRLAETSPHLLRDIGVTGGPVPGAPMDGSSTADLARRIFCHPGCTAGRG